MDPRGFGFDAAAPPAEAAADPRRETDARVVVRAAPDSADTRSADEVERGEDPADEPGYGHGV